MSNLKVIALTSAALLGSTVMIGAAAAMPLNGLTGVNKQVAANVQDVRLVCGPRDCWHEPGPYWRYYHRPYWRYRHYY